MNETNVNQTNTEPNQPQRRMKKCKYCHNDMPAASKKCPHCFKRQNKGEIIVIIIGIFFALMVLSAIVSDDEEKTSEPKTKATVQDDSKNDSKKKTVVKDEADDNNTSDGAYTLGDTFEFDGLEITLGKKCSFVKVNNEFADEYRKDVIKVPVTVKNISGENHSLNMFDYSLFGSKGAELNTVAYYFDGSIDEAKDLKPGASYKKYFYVLYDGDGTYSIDFDDFSENVSVEFDVKK